MNKVLTDSALDVCGATNGYEFTDKIDIQRIAIL